MGCFYSCEQTQRILFESEILDKILAFASFNARLKRREEHAQLKRSEYCSPCYALLVRMTGLIGATTHFTLFKDQTVILKHVYRAKWQQTASRLCLIQELG